MEDRKLSLPRKMMATFMLALVMLVGGLFLSGEEASAAHPADGFQVWFEIGPTAGYISSPPRKTGFSSLDTIRVGQWMSIDRFSVRGTSTPLYCIEPGVNVAGSLPHFRQGNVTNNKILSAYAYSQVKGYNQEITQALIWGATGGLTIKGVYEPYWNAFNNDYNANPNANIFKGASGVYYTTAMQSQFIASFEYTPQGASLTIGKSNGQGLNYLARPESNLKLNGYSLAGATFEIWHEDYTTNGVPNRHIGAKPFATVVTDHTGITPTIDIPKGRYLIEEVKPTTTGTKLTAAPQWITVDTQPVYINFYNDPVYRAADFNVRKVDQNTGERLQGAVFQVKYYDTWNQDWDNLNSMQPLRTWEFTTDANGYLVFNNTYKTGGGGMFTNSYGTVILPLGVYVVTEVTPPAGYRADTTPYRLKIHQVNYQAEIMDVDNKLTPTGPGGKMEMVMNNDKTGGGINLYKSIGRNTNYVARPENELKLMSYTLAGATFEIWHEDYTTNGKPNYHTGAKPSAILVTNENGMTNSVKLPNGRYLIVETTPTNGGTKLTTQPEWITITEDRHTTRSYYNDPVIGDVSYSITKVDKYTRQPLAGAVFQVEFYNTLNEDPENIASMEPIRTWEFTSDSNGKVFFTNAYRTGGGGMFLNQDGSFLPMGVYKVKEIKAPDGYAVDGEEFRFKIVQEGDQGVFKDLDGKFPGKVAVLENDNTGGFSINKVDETGKAITGGDDKSASFTVRDSGGTLVKFTLNSAGNYSRTTGNGVTTIKTNPSTGNLIVDKIPAGIYTITETVAPSGYDRAVSSQSIEVILGGNREVPFTNNTIRGSLTVNKVDGDGAKITSANATFTMKDSSGTLMRFNRTSNGNYTYAANGSVTSLVTYNGVLNVNGIATGTYTLTETFAPMGYKISTANQNFTITASQRSQTLTFVNEEEVKSAILQISKLNNSTGAAVPNARFRVSPNSNMTDYVELTTGADGVVRTSMDEGTYYIQEVFVPSPYVLDNSISTFNLSATNTSFVKRNDVAQGQIRIVKTGELGSAVQGAVFEVRNSGGTLVDTITTNASGIATSKTLPLGTYKVKEKAAPEPYVLNTTEYTATLTYANQTTPIVTSTLNIPNSVAQGQIEIRKTDVSTGAVIQGAVFEVRNSSGVLVDTITTNASGIARSKGLPLGAYTVQEASVPAPYILDSTQHSVNLEYSDQSTPTVLYRINVTNEEAQGPITINKTREGTSTPIQGAVFEVRNASNVLVDTVTTNASGVATTKPLPIGTYKVKEKSVPAPYVLDTTERTVNLQYNQASSSVFATLNVTNRVQLGSFQVNKFWATNKIGEATLANAKFRVTVQSLEVTGVAGQKQPGEVLGEYNTDNKGQFSVAAPLGTYLVEEITPSTGAVRNPNIMKVTLSTDVTGKIIATYDNADVTAGAHQSLNSKRAQVADGSVGTNQTSSLDGAFAQTPILGRISLTKKYESGNDSPTNADLNESGIQFQIINSKGEVVETITTDSNGSAITGYLPYGTYTISQVNVATDSQGNELSTRMDNVDVLIGEDGRTYHYNFFNTTPAFAIEVVKVDSVTGKTIQQSGVQFKLYDASTDKEVNLGTAGNLLTTNSEGLAYSSTRVPAGDYYLKEVKGPEGYYTNLDEVYEVKIPYQTNDSSVTKVTVIIDGTAQDAISTDVVNQPQVGQITFYKVGEQFKSWEEVPATVKIQEEGYTEEVVTTKPQANVALILRTTMDSSAGPVQPKETYYNLTYGTKSTTVENTIDWLRSIRLEVGAIIPQEYVALKPGETAPRKNVVVSEDNRGYTAEDLYVYTEKVETEPSSSDLVNKQVVKEETVYTNSNGYFSKTMGEGTHELFIKDNEVLARLRGPGTISLQLPDIEVKGEKRVDGKVVDKTYQYNVATYEEKLLAGAVFEVRAAEDIVSKDGQTSFFKKGDPVSIAQRDIVVSGETVYKKGDVVTLPKLSATIMNNKTYVDSKFTTNATEPIKLTRVPLGRYEFKEVQSPEGFKLNQEASFFEIEAAGNEVQVIEVSDTMQNDRQILTATLNKKVVEETDYFGRGGYEGIVFGLYTNETIHGLPADSLVAILTPDANGVMTVEDIPGGNYYFKEISTKDGYKLVEDKFEVELDFTNNPTEDREKVIEHEVVNEVIKKEIKLVKVDVDTNQPISGVEFELYAVRSDGTQVPVLNGNVNRYITNQFGEILVGNLPLGSYIWKEVKAAVGYVMEENIHHISVSEDSNLELITSNKRTELALRKYDSYTGKPVVGATLQLVDANGNPIRVVRDANGVWTVTYDGTGEIAQWVTDGSYMIIRGLAVGPSYSVVEAKTPEGYATAEQVDFTVGNSRGIQLSSVENKLTEVEVRKIDESSHEPVYGATLELHEVNEDGTVKPEVFVDPHTNQPARWTTSKENGGIYKINGLTAGKEYIVLEIATPSGYHEPYYTMRFLVADRTDNQIFTLTNEPIPTIATTALFSDGLKNSQNKVVTVVDVVELTKLVIGETYTAYAELVNRETGATIATKEVEFIADKAEMGVEVTFEGVDASQLRGVNLVVTEELRRGNRVVAEHKELADEAQTVRIPEVRTKAQDPTDNSKDALASESTTLEDIVSYKALTPNQEYKLVGYILDEETGERLNDDQGRLITVEKLFTPTSENGEVTVEFTFSGTSLAGKTIVFEEYLYDGTTLVALHSDINDGDQTIYLPGIGTTATNDFDNSKNLVATENQTIKDVVSYSNLTVGETYTVRGTLMDKETGEPLLVDGKQITAEHTFVAEQTSGTVDIYFTLDASELHGKEIVVFEELYRGDKLIAEHKDINDTNQTVEVNRMKMELPVTGSTTLYATLLVSLLAASYGLVLKKKEG